MSAGPRRAAIPAGRPHLRARRRAGPRTGAIRARPQAPPVRVVASRMTPLRSITTRVAQIWIDDEDILHIDCAPGVQLTKSDIEAGRAAIEELSCHSKLPHFVDLRTVSTMDREARVLLAGPGTGLAAAILISSPLSRVIGNFILGFHKPRVPSRLFTEAPEALTWLRGFLA